MGALPFGVGIRAPDLWKLPLPARSKDRNGTRLSGIVNTSPYQIRGLHVSRPEFSRNLQPSPSTS